MHSTRIAGLHFRHIAHTARGAAADGHACLEVVYQPGDEGDEDEEDEDDEEDDDVALHSCWWVGVGGCWRG
ncbi:hypothetical protein BU16DRAFT_527684 [Lophium mytilinum]|uniref:Uncharacterized protein n=1 Tax=Lophium mytilinum TaxID=390894 RepID=A0A6A6QRN8_9PEZI|nr:hypothetical protein BU16DRAFT_527684 [Lophium mytilinum]